MEFIRVTSTSGYNSGVVLTKDGMVQVVSPLLGQSEYSFKEFDRFVATYRKARRESGSIEAP